MADVDDGRVAFALEHGFADVGYLASPNNEDTVANRLSNAKTMALEIGKLSSPEGGDVGRFDHVFECTGVESCVQASIYVSPFP
jgi:L-iditol 2-dehydrogenase